MMTTSEAVANWTGRRYARVLTDQGDRGHGHVGVGLLGNPTR
jgi:hypothetical protein